MTTGVWKFVKNVIVAPIFEPDNIDLANPSLVDLTNKCKDFIDGFNLIAQKDLLISFLKDTANEFSRPFSSDLNAYLFSAAYSNYMLEAIDTIDPAKRVEGIVYPTCKGIYNIRHIGLNYALKTSAIGFGKKIEFVNAIRGKLVKVEKTVTAVDVMECKHIDKNTAIITWPQGC